MYFDDVMTIILNLNQYLTQFVENMGGYIYVGIFVVMFLETGILIGAFIPGDSFAFAIAALASSTDMNPFLVLGAVMLGAFFGDITSYFWGKKIGHRLFHDRGHPRWIARLFGVKRIEQTMHFVQRTERKTLIFSRFIPMFRYFISFVAGYGEIPFVRFAKYTAIGIILWAPVYVGVGYLFGNIPWVKQNLAVVIIGVICLSFFPSFVRLVYAKVQERQATKSKKKPS